MACCQANGCEAEATVVADWRIGGVPLTRHYCDEHAAMIVRAIGGPAAPTHPGTPAPGTMPGAVQAPPEDTRP